MFDWSGQHWLRCIACSVFGVFFCSIHSFAGTACQQVADPENLLRSIAAGVAARLHEFASPGERHPALAWLRGSTSAHGSFHFGLQVQFFLEHWHRSHYLLWHSGFAD
ncbi:MAG: hypothetical protein JO108_18690 [Acidobacteriaceae bacterium]|nr:hypothetical protein [Acidobacteriaceae bacterium]